jgi:predicted Zn-dependent peptidase
MDARYEAVTTEDIKHVANQYFNNKPHAVIIVTPSEGKN